MTGGELLHPALVQAMVRSEREWEAAKLRSSHAWEGGGGTSEAESLTPPSRETLRASGAARRLPALVDAGLWTVSYPLLTFRTFTNDRPCRRRVRVPRAPERDVSNWRGQPGPLPAGAGLFERDPAFPERKGHKKEHAWVLVSKNLTLLPAPPKAV